MLKKSIEMELFTKFCEKTILSENLNYGSFLKLFLLITSYRSKENNMIVNKEELYNEIYQNFDLLQNLFLGLKDDQIKVIKDLYVNKETSAFDLVFSELQS